MTWRQRLFAYHYLANGGNAMRAAEAVGYSLPQKNANRLLKSPGVQALIAQEVDKAAMPAEEVLARLSQHAAGDAGDFAELFAAKTHAEMKRALLALKRRGLSCLVRKIGRVRGGFSIELHDAQAAMVRLGNHHRLWTEKVEVSLDPDDLADLSYDELQLVASGKKPGRLIVSRN